MTDKIDYDKLFNEFKKDKDIAESEDEVRTVKGFVKWLMINKIEINIVKFRAWKGG